MIFEELDFQHTPLGDISLRRRAEPRLGGQVLYEVKLNDEFLMSSLVTVAEEQLAILGLQQLEGEGLDIVVGGLGLGYTAAAVLKDPRVRTLKVIDVMAPVIDWHKDGLVPLGKVLTSDPRCSLVLADFFEVAIDQPSFNSSVPGERMHAVLLDIDHSPSHWLNEGNRSFYTGQGLTRLKEKLQPGGLFGLWSNDPPDNEFNALLASVFASAQAHRVDFPNPYTGAPSTQTVYLART